MAGASLGEGTPGRAEGDESAGGSVAVGAVKDDGDRRGRGGPSTRRTRPTLQGARESLERAKRLIKRTDKPYGPHVPDWAEWRPPEYVGVFKKGDIVGYQRRDAEIEQLEKALKEWRMANSE